MVPDPCPAKNCPRRRHPTLPMCNHHWYALPPKTRNTLYRMALSDRHSPNFTLLMSAAVEWLDRREASTEDARLRFDFS
jgi:uncharacterized protein YecT (DUF1311 family)